MKRSYLVMTALAGAAALGLAGWTQPEKPQPSGQASAEPVEGPGGEPMAVLGQAAYTLVVQDLKYGQGPEVKRDSTITVRYHGTLADGTVFDTTRGKEPATFEIGKLVMGWQAGLRGMKEGGVRRLVIPPIMAYGDKDRLGDDGSVQIPAGSTLTFAIELVRVENKETSGLVTLPGGLKYEDLKIGTGKECQPGATVTMNYRGTFPDGRQFDASAPGDPLVYPLGRLIKGWQEGVPGMKVGGKRKLYVPWQLAYGAQGMPPDIPPKADMVFEIELLDTK
ncbi:MAG: FKBP-type peptidyl-prolyl cis-trans isomerase [Phycisphaerales bacterium]|nr:FKBP-type peptidyl-prolyl cis-trans isomerase [Phycisphaerales bacterium]